MDLSDVRVVFGPDDLARVGRFRYGVYIEEQGKATPWADHEGRVLIEPADRSPLSTVFFIERDAEIVGTVRVEILDHHHAESENLGIAALDFVEPREILYFSRLMVKPSARRSDVMPKLCFLGFLVGLLRECRLGVMTCKPGLVRLFQSYGYRQHADAFVHGESGAQVPMSVVAEVDYLSARAAPLAGWLAAHRPDSRVTDRFNAYADAYAARAAIAADIEPARRLTA